MKGSSSTKILDNSQLEDYDWEFIDEKKREIIYSYIDKDYPDGKFTFLDIGGGNGSFTDHLLNKYQQSHGTVLDNSDFLLKKNNPHKNKTVVLGSAIDINSIFNNKFDIIFYNFVLHHLVTGSYNSTRLNQSSVLKFSQKLLTDRGKVSIFENIYDGYLLSDLPGYLIFRLTSMKSIAPLTKRLGANTAGIGVCFLSYDQWISTFNSSNIKVEVFKNEQEFKIPRIIKIILHLGYIRNAHFWCSVDH